MGCAILPVDLGGEPGRKNGRGKARGVRFRAHYHFPLATREEKECIRPRTTPTQ
jgi:hypothetical protein